MNRIRLREKLKDKNNKPNITNLIKLLANPQVNFPENFLFSHCWAQAFTVLLGKPAPPQKSQWSQGGNNIHTALCWSWGMLTLHVWYYPLPTREGRTEIISLVYRWKYWVPQNFLKTIWIDKITHLVRGRARIRTHTLSSKSTALFPTCTDSYDLLWVLASGHMTGRVPGASGWAWPLHMKVLNSSTD